MTSGDATVKTRHRTRTRALGLLKIAVPAALLALMVSWVDFRVVGELLGRMQIVFVLAAIAILLQQAMISALKWKSILKADDHEVSWLFLWKTYLIGAFVSLFLPTSFGGDVYRVYAIRHEAQTISRGAASVLFERLTGLMALVTLAFLGSLFLDDARIVLGIALLYTTLAAAFLVMSSGAVVQKLQLLHRGRLTGVAVKICETFHRYRQQKGVLLITVILSFWFQLNIVLVSKCHTLALGLDVPFTSLLLIIPVIFLTEVLPITIHGLGVREGAFAYLFTVIGRTAEEGLAVAVMVVTLKYLLGSIGGWILLYRSVRSGAVTGA